MALCNIILPLSCINILHSCFVLWFVGITTFEIEYGHWIEEHHKQISELRNALQARITDIELRILVENGLNHYNNLFRMKADAANADVFYLISGKWRTSVERFFQWIGGFRPSELLNVRFSPMYVVCGCSHGTYCCHLTPQYI